MRTLLRNLTLIEATGAPPIKDCALVVDGSRIAEVHQRPEPAGAFDVTVDLGGRTCLPGLIDLHVHLCWDGTTDPAEVKAAPPC